MESDIEMVAGCHGLHVGMLSEWEMGAFDRLCAAGLASRSYEGAAGFMGVAKVCVHADKIAAMADTNT